MRKTTALTLGVLLLLSFLFFMSPVGRYVITAPFSGNETPSPSAEATDQLPFALPQGFSAQVFADNVPGARVMVRDPKGALVASLTSEGKVVALPDIDANGKADSVITILEGLRNPHGILFHCPNTGNASADQDACRLYVAEEDVVQSYAYDADTFTISNPRTIASLPSGSGHYTRSLILLDENTLLVSVGSSCNVCEEKDARRAKVLAVDIEAGAFGELTEYATGLRNTVFMTTHYVTGDIWGTEMGRDNLGDDLPPDEINILDSPSTRSGQNSIPNFGWPFCYGKGVRDAAFRSETSFDCSETVPSKIDIPAHSAPLGIAFIPEEGWPEHMWYDALVAYHGSWERSTPTGYKIVRLPLDAEGNLEGAPQDFMTGLMDKNGNVVGRPVDILLEPGGVMYVSDDKAGKIYRTTRTSQGYLPRLNLG